MEPIILSDEQAKRISESKQPIEVRDSNGTMLGYLSYDFTPEEIAIAKQRMHSDQPRYTTQQVMAHLRSLGDS